MHGIILWRNITTYFIGHLSYLLHHGWPPQRHAEIIFPTKWKPLCQMQSIIWLGYQDNLSAPTVFQVSRIGLSKGGFFKIRIDVSNCWGVNGFVLTTWIEILAEERFREKTFQLVAKLSRELFLHSAEKRRESKKTSASDYKGFNVLEGWGWFFMRWQD